MSRTILIIALCLFAHSALAQNIIEDFFSPIPAPALGVASNKAKWEFRPTVTLPALKVTKSVRENAQLDAQILTSTGGGISYQHLNYNVNTKKWSSDICFSLCELLSGEIQDKDAILNLSSALFAGFFNNILMIGVGYDHGVVIDRSRWFATLSLGVSFNN